MPREKESATRNPAPTAPPPADQNQIDIIILTLGCREISFSVIANGLNYYFPGPEGTDRWNKDNVQTYFNDAIKRLVAGGFGRVKFNKGKWDTEPIRNAQKQWLSGEVVKRTNAIILAVMKKWEQTGNKREEETRQRDERGSRDVFSTGEMMESLKATTAPPFQPPSTDQRRSLIQDPPHVSSRFTRTYPAQEDQPAPYGMMGGAYAPQVPRPAPPPSLSSFAYPGYIDPARSTEQGPPAPYQEPEPAPWETMGGAYESQHQRPAPPPSLSSVTSSGSIGPTRPTEPGPPSQFQFRQTAMQNRLRSQPLPVQESPLVEFLEPGKPYRSQTAQGPPQVPTRRPSKRRPRETVRPPPSGYLFVQDELQDRVSKSSFPTEESPLLGWEDPATLADPPPMEREEPETRGRSQASSSKNQRGKGSGGKRGGRRR